MVWNVDIKIALSRIISPIAMEIIIAESTYTGAADRSFGVEGVNLTYGRKS